MRGDLLDVIQEIENNFMEPEKLYILNICLGTGTNKVFSGNYVDEATFYWFSPSIHFLAVPRSG